MQEDAVVVPFCGGRARSARSSKHNASASDRLVIQFLIAVVQKNKPNSTVMCPLNWDVNKGRTEDKTEDKQNHNHIRFHRYVERMQDSRYCPKLATISTANSKPSDPSIL